MSSKAIVFDIAALEITSMENVPIVPMTLRYPRLKKLAIKEKQKKPMLVNDLR